MESRDSFQPESNPFTRIVQIGLVARDKKKVLASMKEIFGLSPSRCLMTREDGARRYYGEAGDFSAELIFYDFGGVELEFIIPIQGRSIWQDALDEDGEGLHHLQFSVDSFRSACEAMAEKGVRVSQEGASASKIPGLRWGYFDTKEKLSFIVEISNPSEVLNSAGSPAPPDGL